jgi:hypothetical protein
MNFRWTKHIKHLLILVFVLLAGILNSCTKELLVAPEENIAVKQKDNNSNLHSVKRVGTYADEVSPGWNAEDATACLQNAINTGDSVIVVRKMSSKWIIKNIKLKRANQEIFFEEGVEVKAKRGEFHARTSPLFNIEAANVKMIGYGVTLSMWKEDYMDPDKYEFAEWRHCIRVMGAKNFTIKGFTLRDSGGDGIEIAGNFSGTSYSDWSSGLIEDVVSDNNYRQGISICSAKGLIVRNSVFKNTIGTAPQAGIDIEPWAPHHLLQDIYIEGCRFENNAGDDITYTLYHLKGNPPDDVTITFSDCEADGSAKFGILCDVWPEYGPPGGAIKFIDCTVRNSKKDGIRIREIDPRKGSLTFENCKVINCGAGEYDWYYYYPIHFAPWGGPKWEDGIIGNIDFINCGVVDDKNRYAVNFSSNTFSRGGLKNVHGTIMVDNDDTQYLMPSFNEGDTTNVTLKAVRGKVDDPTSVRDYYPE